VLKQLRKIVEIHGKNLERVKKNLIILDLKSIQQAICYRNKPKLTLKNDGTYVAKRCKGEKFCWTKGQTAIAVQTHVSRPISN
jgi:hypothetical protein